MSNCGSLERVERVWDSCSGSQSALLSATLHSLVADYATLNGTSKQMIRLLANIKANLRNALDEHLFMPIYSKTSHFVF